MKIFNERKNYLLTTANYWNDF